MPKAVDAGHIGAGLAGWIARYVRPGEPASIASLDGGELHKLINGLRAYGSRRGLDMSLNPAAEPIGGAR